jgi:hypothetical protein
VSQDVDLEAIRDCLRGGHPSALATCAPDGTPNISFVSLLQYVDPERVATSRQSFNTKLASLAVSPFAQAIVTHPATGEQYRLDLRYLHTATEGEGFEAMRANLEAVGARRGVATGSAFRLRGLDVHRVLRCTRVRPEPLARAATPDLLEPLEQLSGRLERAGGYEETAQAVLEALDDIFGFRYAVLLSLDPPTRRLFAIAGSGGARLAVGADVAVGSGLIGTAAERRRVIVQASMRRSRIMAAAINSTDPGGHEPEIPLPGLAEGLAAAAVPLIVGEDVLGVLYLESETPGAFSGAMEGVLHIIGMHTAAALAARGAAHAEEPAPPVPSAPAPTAGPALRLVYYQADDTVLCDSEYVVKGAPGRILWSMLRAHADAGRTDFSNRELRLDESLGLPAGNDNLEARLLVLRRRLAAISCGITLERVGRGRLELQLERPATLFVVPTSGPMRGAYQPR